MIDDADRQTLMLQARKDPDIINRFIAFYRLAEQEIIRLIEHPEETASLDFLELFHELLADDDLSGKAGGLHLTMFDSVSDPRYAYRYTALYQARKTIEYAFASRYKSELIDFYQRLDRFIPLTAPMGLQKSAIRERRLKNRCLGILSLLDTPEIRDIIRAQLDGNGVASDRFSAFAMYLNSTAPDRINILESFERVSSAHPVSWEAFLSAVGSVLHQMPYP